jgi:membrane-bound lytic murein transglycosylase D
MNKLLLLATSLISLTVPGNATGAPEQGKETTAHVNHVVVKDSSGKEELVHDPKLGFKDLFEDQSSSNGLTISQLNPQAIAFVKDYVATNTDRLEKMKGWGKPYFDMMDGVLTKYNLPIELKYLSVIESNLKSSATSWAGAVGPWQFMPETARLLGLKVSKGKDERTDFKKSTVAAARYLTELYGIYHDWLLVIAAYNTGPGNVNSAIRRSGSRNFWTMQSYLPAETRGHVKKFIATQYIMEGGIGLTTLTKSETENLMLNPATAVTTSDLATLNISGKYNSIVIAQTVQMDQATFNRLNPNFDRLLSAKGSFDLRLPNDKMTLFQASKPQILEQSIRLMLQTASR